MGGPFLEDFKVVHAATSIKRMTSIEIDANTFLRQKFNRPLTCIQLLNEASSDFIHRYSFDDSVIFWLDFTKARSIGVESRRRLRVDRKTEARRRI
jgi:hypothetical protein